MTDFNNPGLLMVLEESLVKRLLDSYYRRFIEGLNLRGNEQVLDFGCGGGLTSRHIADRLSAGGSLTCLDTSEYWLSKVRSRLKKYNNIEYVSEDITTSRVKDFSFDIIVIHFMLHDVKPVKRSGIITALTKKLKDDGRVYIREPVRERHGMPAKDIRLLFSEAGLKEIYFSLGKPLLIGPIYDGVYYKAPNQINRRIV